ncbi:hypothetical protein H632_c317p3 [Helicosporidium sp. ATCC 50920]|nr:hypothetical protein H632_c317p3 [Helicosporidium sp. ATCC 50920]|eukprot:KDD76203.1 hypothetical protein H632_c317p3 [Helicosporidium sp. ATCC 50920]
MYGNEWEDAALSRLRPPAPLTLLARRKLQTLSLTPAELLAATACEVVPSFLPEALASKLLLALSRASKDWIRGRWYINGALRDGRMTSRAYFFAKSGGESAGVGGEADWAAAEGRAETGDASDPVHCSRSAPARQSLLSRRAGVDLASWEPTLVLANRYADGRQAVGAHSDMLTTLGPAPLVASLSLGATRTFRLRRRVNMPRFFDAADVQVGARPDLLEGSASIPAVSRAPSAAVLPGWEVFDVLLPHNALLLMYPGVQEAFTHEIVPEASVRPHPLVGSTRFNLTFRAARPEWVADVPRCHCRRPACLKPRGPSLRQKKGQQAEAGLGAPLELVWAYVCDHREGEPCGFYKAAFKVPIVAGQEKLARS